MPPDPAIASLATDPNARVMAFVDGQNLYKTCKELFRHPLCHPHLLAQHLAQPRRNHRIAVRFYTGRPDHNRPAERVKARNLDRRLNQMDRAGVTVIKRQLRYHWDWGHRQELPPPGPNVPAQQVTLTPWERPQEKGIDVAIALDLVEFALTNKFDVAIVVSLDRDLHEIADALRNLKPLIARPIRLEAAVPVRGERSAPKTIKGFHFTHQITPEVFELVRDDTDYTAGEDRWSPSVLPASLKERPR